MSATTPKAKRTKKVKVKSEAKNGLFDADRFATDMFAKREADGVTFSALSEATGLNRSTLYRAEAKMPVDLNTICKISNWMNKRVQDYLTK